MAFGPSETLLATLEYRVIGGQKFANEEKKTAQAMSSIDRRLKRTSVGMRGLTKSLAFTANAVSNLTSRWLAMGSAIATTLVIFKSISDAQKFGIAMAEIGTIFEGTESSLNKVEKQILSLSKSLGFAENIAAKGFYQIISTDITDAADATLVLNESAELATVGLANLKDTVNLVTSVIKSYRTGVEESNRITDILFKTVIKGRTTIPELATSLGQVLPLAATLKVPLEEVAAAIATITQGGIETNTAVIQLRQALNQILKPSADAATVLNKYSIDISAARVSSEGFAAVLKDLEDNIGGNAKALSTIFGNVRALLPVLALTGNQADQFRKNIDAITKSSGAVGNALEKFLLNPFKRFQVFFNRLRIEMQGIGRTFITELDKQITKRGGIEVVSDKIKVVFAGLEEVARNAAQAVGRVFDGLDIAITSLGGLKKAEDIFRSVGDIIGNVIEAAVLGFANGIALIVSVLARLPKIIAKVSFEMKTLANDMQQAFDSITPDFVTGDLALPFPEVASPKIQREEVQRYIDKLKLELEELQQKAQVAIAKDPVGGTGRRVRALRIKVPQTPLHPPAAPHIALGEQIANLEKAIAQREKLLADAAAQAEQFKQIQLEPILDEHGIEAMKKGALVAEEFQKDFGKSVDALLLKLGELDDAVKEEMEKSANTIETAADAWLRLLGPLSDEFEGFAETIRRVGVPKLDPAEFERGVQDQLAILLTLLEGDLGLNVPIDLDVESALAPGGSLAALEQLKEFAERTLQVTIPTPINDDNIKQTLENIIATQTTVVDLQGEINTGVTAEYDELKKTEALRRNLLKLDLQRTNATKELVDAATQGTNSLFDQAERRQRELSLGFENLPDFLADAFGGAEVPLGILLDQVELQRKEWDQILQRLEEVRPAIAPFVDALREAKEAAGAANIAQALDFTTVGAELEKVNEVLEGSAQAQIALARARGQIERQRLLDVIKELELSREQEDILRAIADNAEAFAVNQALGFRSLADEQERLSASVQFNLQDQIALVRLRGQQELDHLDLIADQNRGYTLQVEKLKELVGQSTKLQELEALRAQLDSPVFDLGSAVDNARKQLEITAKAPILKALGLDGLPNAAKGKFDIVRDDYRDSLDEMLTSGKAFSAGFGAALTDIAEDMTDTFRQGVELANSSIESLRSSFSRALSEVILGVENIDDIVLQFRENLARGLSQAVSDALTDQLLGPIVGLLGDRGPSPEDVTRDLFVELAKQQQEGMDKLVEASLAAQGEIADKIIENSDSLVHVLDTPAVGLTRAAELLQAAAISLGAEDTLEEVVGDAPFIPTSGPGSAVADAAGEGVDSAALLSAFTPVITALELAASSVGAAGAGAKFAFDLAAGFIQTAAGELGIAAFDLQAAAIKLGATTAAGATGGIFPRLSSVESPSIQMGDGGIAPIKMGLGGVKRSRTFAEIAERGQPEAVVPLPGAGREIPVEFKNAGQLGGGGGNTVQMTVEVRPSFTFQNLDPRGTQEVVAQQMPTINRMLSAALTSGRDRNLEQAIQQVAKRRG